MKRLLILPAAAILMLATRCTQPEAELPAPPEIISPEAFAVTPSEAVDEAREALAAIAPATRSGAVEVRSVVRHGAQAAADAAEVDPSLYVVNFAADGGFAIVAADRRQSATVYAVSDEGSFPDPATLEDGTLSFLYQRIETLAAIPSKRPKVMYFTGPWRDIARINPLVKVRWGIGDPYNQIRQVTAFCQIMSYYQVPKSYDWNLILGKLQVTIQDLAAYEEKINKEIARLFSDVAAKYRSGELVNWIGAFGYYCKLSETYSYEKVFQQIDRYKRPVYASASTVYGYIPQSYTWIMDGYLQQERTITAAPDPVRPGETPEPYPSDPRYETRTLVHCNLGNDGKGNGFYLSTLFDLHTGADVPDSGNTGQNGYVDGQVEYSPSDIRITTNIDLNYFVAQKVDSVLFISELKLKP